MVDEDRKGMDASRRVAFTLGGAVLSAPATYVVQRALGVWGVLDAISDALGNWLKIHVEPGFAGWTLALMLVFAVYGFLLWKVWRPRHIHHLPMLTEAQPRASVEVGIRHATPPSPPADISDIVPTASLGPMGRQESRLGRPLRDQERDHDGVPLPITTKPPRPRWIPLHQALHYLVYDSRWASKQPPAAGKDQFNDVVSIEVREHLARGEIKARGKRGWGAEARKRATEEISQEFWVDAFFLPWGSIALGNRSEDAACKQGGGGEQWCGIIVNDVEVRRVWPRRTFPPGSSKEPTQLSTLVEDLSAQCADGDAEIERLRRPEPPDVPLRKGYELTDDSLAGLERVTQALSGAINVHPDPIGDYFRRMADRSPLPPRRDVTLGEAMLYVLRGRWGLDFSDFDPHRNSYDLETIKWQFEEMAEDGRIQVWGSDSWAEGRYTRIEPSEWKHLKIQWQSLVEGKPRTTSKSDISPVELHYNLMVNKAQIEEQFRRVAAPPPSSAEVQPRAFMGTTNAALFGVDGPKSAVIIDIKNFGQTPARDVRWKAVAGYFVTQPENAEGGGEGTLGITEPGHEQNIKLILTRPVTSAEIQQYERGGPGLYAIAEIDYADVNGKRHRRSIAYYCDPEGIVEPGKRMLDSCSRGNDEISEEAAKRPWYEERTRFTIREAGCLAAKVGPTEFDTSDLAHSKASELRYYVSQGRIPVAGESPDVLAARRSPMSAGLSLPPVTLDTYVTKRDLEHFLDKPLRVWLDVQDEAHWRTQSGA